MDLNIHTHGGGGGGGREGQGVIMVVCILAQVCSLQFELFNFLSIIHAKSVVSHNRLSEILLVFIS